ncbi:hypothetical protein Ddye_028229 [Dipteronia dyeriana]|uniref:Uncharacterized protein n=1 Tax=Dipteronia dyeriana TaxID=168575 RepID=A0AAD9TQK6_9ROSI|nr:hypothetical protein Ddye_028229 [Dipteronia dyeriana]
MALESKLLAKIFTFSWECLTFRNLDLSAQSLQNLKDKTSITSRKFASVDGGCHVSSSVSTQQSGELIRLNTEIPGREEPGDFHGRGYDHLLFDGAGSDGVTVVQSLSIVFAAKSCGRSFDSATSKFPLSLRNPSLLRFGPLCGHMSVSRSTTHDLSMEYRSTDRGVCMLLESQYAQHVTSGLLRCVCCGLGYCLCRSCCRTTCWSLFSLVVSGFTYPNNLPLED